MAYDVIADTAAEVIIQPDSVVSKVVHRDDEINVTVFGFDAGQELTEHKAARAAIVQVISGRLRFTVDGDLHDAGPGWWMHMAPEAPHALTAVEPTVMLLTLLKP